MRSPGWVFIDNNAAALISILPPLRSTSSPVIEPLTKERLPLVAPEPASTDTSPPAPLMLVLAAALISILPVSPALDAPDSITIVPLSPTALLPLLIPTLPLEDPSVLSLLTSSDCKST